MTDKANLSPKIAKARMTTAQAWANIIFWVFIAICAVGSLHS